MEIYWRDNFTCPTESEYKQMTIRKTGGLFMLAIRLMQLFSDSKQDFSKLTAILGLYFQIRDDYCNLICKEVRFATIKAKCYQQLTLIFHLQYSESKSFCEDLTEGKFSFPIIHAVNNQTNDRQVLREYFVGPIAFGIEKDFNTKLTTCFGSFILQIFYGNEPKTLRSRSIAFNCSKNWVVSSTREKFYCHLINRHEKKWPNSVRTTTWIIYSTIY